MIPGHGNSYAQAAPHFCLTANTMAHQRDNRVLPGIFAIAILLRLAAAVYFGDSTDPAIDEFSYSALAARVADGHGFSFDEDWYPFTPAGTLTAHWSFLYTGFVAAIYAIAGYHPLVVRLVQSILGGILLPWLAYHLTKRLFPARHSVAVIAAACTAIYAYFILYAALLMTETFFIAALLWSLERAMALAGSGDGQAAWRWETAATLGVSLGLAALLRQSILPWVALLFVWLLAKAFTGRESNNPLHLRVRRGGMVVATGLIILLFILPFTVRNYLAYGELMLLNSNAGYAMYSAQHPLHGTDFQAFTAAPLPQELLGQGLNEAQWDRALMARGIGFVLADPIRYFRLSASRLLDYFEFWPTETTLLHNAGRLLSFTLFLPVFVAGIWTAARQNRRQSQDRVGLWRRPAGLVFLFMLFYTVLHIFTWAMPRYRLPVDAVAMPFAALALQEAGQWVHRCWAKGWRLMGYQVNEPNPAPKDGHG